MCMQMSSSYISYLKPLNVFPQEVAVSALLRKSKSRDEDSSSVVPWEENKMASSGLAHRSDHSYDERDDLFFDSDDERAADIMDNSDEG